ncbi:hypothetical protein CVT26_004715 [Gymnopilus dilepis]|uniref:HMG box domain-containing protein n=1 Tax=Gymnopilus dilepis TaxID=231916 RepID=A0A409XZE0_9AGAR|nr:hypothetical protein CVT26_004715 [Gymnopilus dilepis]
MSRCSTDYSVPSTARSSNTLSLQHDRHFDERASQSGSEDGSYALYTDAHKIEAELEGMYDPNAALTSQTLNADGTPKRPMNAFMIFARRRRPQVSAENQSMRTGEISKILSREWVSMPASEKQFYLEQAKQLKETFNTRYPDYVYRRRPNNSRKRRRSDAGTMRPVDPTLLADQGDELVANVDFESSPIEAEGHLEASLPLSTSFPRPPSYDIRPTPLDQAKYGSNLSRSASHQVAPEPMFRSNGHHDPRLPYVSAGNSDRVASNLGSSASPRDALHGLHYPYGQSPSHSQSPAIFGTAESTVTGHQGWQSRVDRPTPPWLSGGHDRITASISTQKQPPYSPTGSWSGSAENSSTRSDASPSSTNFFPTLNTPFYPTQPQASPFQSHVASSSPHAIPQPSSFEPLNLQPSSLPRDFVSRGYEASISPDNAYPPPASGRDALPYSQRILPPVQAGPSYHQASSSPAPGHGGYWNRD